MTDNVEKSSTSPSIQRSFPPPLPEQNESKDSLLSFSAKGRLGRLSLQAAILALVFVVVILGSLLLILGVTLIPRLSGNISSVVSNSLVLGMGVVSFVCFTLVAALVYLTIVLYVRRLHDLNLSRWWILFASIPGVISTVFSYFEIDVSVVVSIIPLTISVLFYLYLILAPGTKGANRFGLQRPTSYWEKIFGMISLVLIVPMVAAWQYKQFVPTSQHPTDTKSVTTLNHVEKTISSKYQAPYPFTAQELWTKILKVTALPDGDLGKSQIEDSFGVMLKPLSNPITERTIYRATAGKDWYFSLWLDPGKHKGSTAFFFFNWTNEISSSGEFPPAGMCIKAGDVKSSLLNQGWVIQNSEIDSFEDRYQKGATSVLRIPFDATMKCIKAVDLGSQ